MKKILASFIAAAFLFSGGFAMAQEKKQESTKEQAKKADKKGEKSAAGATKGDKTTPAPKKKREGC